MMNEKIFTYKDPNTPEVAPPQPFTFTTADNLSLHAVKWLPKDAPKAVIVLVHGIAEHSGRYEHVAEQLTNAGFVVYAYDHRSHGKSAGEPRTYIAPFTLAVDDLTRYVELVRGEHPNTKIFVYGHSMGSLISLLYVLKHQDKIAGWISSGSPLTVETSVPKPTLLFLLTLSKVLPTLRLAKIDPTALTHDENIVQAYSTDPLCDAQPTRLGMASAIVSYSKQANEQLPTLKLPILLLHGSADTVCPASASQLIHEKAGSTDKTLKLYYGLLHEIHNEPLYGRIMSDVIEWVLGRCDK